MPSFPRFSLVALSVFALALSAQEDALTPLEKLVTQLIRLERLEQKTISEWSGEKKLLENELTLEKRRLEQLEKDKATAEEARDKAQGEEQAAAKGQRVSAQRVEAFFPPIREAEKRLLALQPQLPSALTRGLKAQFAALQNAKGDVTRENALERLRGLLSLLAEIERFDATVHLTRETIADGKGKEREMDVIYLGLSQAFAVSDDNLLASCGRPGETGWSWSWKPEIVTQVRQIIDIQKKNRPASLISLPLGGEEVRP